MFSEIRRLFLVVLRLLNNYINTIKDFNLNTLFCVPTTILNLAEYISTNDIKGINIQKIYFGGESMFADQREKLEKVFPGVSIKSVGYASVDGGLLGYADNSCGFNEHRQFDNYNIIEIIDEETGLPITESNKKGKVYSTNLSRLLMPIIRYPVGDNGMWLENESVENRKFMILGRSEEGARIGPITLYLEDFLHIINKYKNRLKFENIQLVIDHFDNKDQLTIRIGTNEIIQQTDILNEEIVNNIYNERHCFIEEINNGKIHPIKLEITRPNNIEINERTGKMKLIIDHRFNNPK